MYPLAFRITDKHLLFFGAGPVALRKIKSFLSKETPKITVIAPLALKELCLLAKDEKIKLINSKYAYGDVEKIGADFCFVCTDSDEVNREIVRECKKLRVPVNVADSPEESDFHMPAVFTEGGVTVSVSTDGESPAKAAEIRDMLRGCFEDPPCTTKINPYNIRF